MVSVKTGQVDGTLWGCFSSALFDERTAIQWASSAACFGRGITPQQTAPTAAATASSLAAA